MIDATIGNRWFRGHPAPGGRPTRRLVCLPHAGGTAGVFHSWGGRLGDGVEVLAACYPGRQARFTEPSIDSMDALADALTEALLPFLDLPVSVFGHSLGASVAYEVALRLEHRYGVRPQGLHVSSRRAPHRVRPKATYLGGEQAVIDEVLRLGGTEAELLHDPELREIVLPPLLADFRIVGTYQPQPGHPVSCPVTGYVGDRDQHVGPADLAAWAEVTTGPFELDVLPGGHFYLLADRERDALLRDLAGRIA